MAYENINLIAGYVKRMQRNKTDSVIGVSGPEGIGKSTCSLQILLRVMNEEKDSDRKFNFERNVAYTAGEVDPKMRAAPTGTGLIIDEAGRLFYKRDAMTARTREGIKLFQQIRFRNLAVFANIPPFFSLDKEIREQRIWLWIHVFSRGKAMYFIKDPNVFSEDPWHTALNQKIIARKYKGPMDGIEALLDGYRETKNFMGEFSFPKLPQDFEERYQHISFDRKLQKDMDGTDTKQVKRWKRVAQAWGKEAIYQSHEAGHVLTQTKLAEMGKISSSVVSRLFDEEVK